MISVAKGMGSVIQSPLAIGSQGEISLCDLCASAVNQWQKPQHEAKKGIEILSMIV